MFICIKKLSCGFAPGYKLQIWSGSPECLDHRNDRVIYLSEDSTEDVIFTAWINQLLQQQWLEKSLFSS